jgi:hypothetical protein
MRRKLGIIAFIAIVVLGLSGAASAATDLSVDNKYLDEDGNEIDSAEVGDIVTYEVDVTNSGDEDATDVTDSLGSDTTSDIDWELIDEKITQGEIDEDTGDWIIGTVVAGSTESLIQKLKVLSAGSELYQEDLYEGDTLVDSSSASIVTKNASGNNGTVKAKTVGMQTTGVPIVPLALAMIMVIGGLAYTRKP